MHRVTSNPLVSAQPTAAGRRGRGRFQPADGIGLVTIYKRPEKKGIASPAARDGTTSLDYAQFEASFAGLDWRRVRALSVRSPAEADWR